MNKMLRSLFAAALAGYLIGAPIGLLAWPGQSDNVYVNATETSNVTVTDYAINQAGQTIAANGDRLFFKACVLSTTTASLYYDFGTTVSTSKSQYISTHSITSADTDDRCFTSITGLVSWMGAINLDVPDTATVTVRTWQYTR